jgi:histidine ammonia-lyase
MAEVEPVTIDAPLDWRAIAEVARGRRLALSDAAWGRVEAAHGIVRAIVEKGIRAYGISTGVGALADTVVDRPSQAALSRNLVMSHAAGVGEPLDAESVRAIMAVEVNTFAQGRSGVRPAVVRALLDLLAAGVVPEVPARGSVGYLTHAAHIALVLIGEGRARIGGATLPGREALAAAALEPLALEAKEGLSLVNGTPCSTGLGAVVLARCERFLADADAVAALTLEALGADPKAFAEDVLAVRRSPGLQASGAALRSLLDGSRLAGRFAENRTQDALSLRAVPHVHGAARDVFAFAGAVVDGELASVTDNPIVSGSPEDPVVQSEAHAVAPALAQALDSLGVAVAQLAAMAERRLDRLINPLVSGFPAFLADGAGVASGFMIAQYTAAALVGENRRLAAPASLDGGLTSALQEDFLAHPTAAALKLHALLDNAEQIVGIELVAAAEAHGHLDRPAEAAPATSALLARIRRRIPRYRDDRPMAELLAEGRALLRAGLLENSK